MEKLTHFHNSELIKQLLHACGIDVYKNAPSLIKSFVTVEESSTADLSKFHVLHEILHTALIAYVIDLFENVLPLEFLQFELVDAEGKIQKYAVPPVLLVQSSLFAEMIVLTLDSVYRNSDHSLQNPNFFLYAPLLQSNMRLEQKLPLIQRELCMSSVDPFFWIVSKLVASAVLIESQRQGNCWDFSTLGRKSEEIVKLAKDLNADDFNRATLEQLTRRLSYLLYLAFEEEGIYSFSNWLNDTSVRFNHLNGAELDCAMTLLRKVVQLGVTDQTSCYQIINTLNQI